MANFRTKLLYSFKCTTLFWLQITISLEMPCTALASWPLDVPRAPPQAPGRQSHAAKGSARNCLGSKAPWWERSTLQHELCWGHRPTHFIFSSLSLMLFFSLSSPLPRISLASKSDVSIPEAIMESFKTLLPLWGKSFKGRI